MKALIILDNASSHRADVLKSWASDTEVILLFNVPYFAKGNPIELFFSELKNHCKDISTSNH